MQYGHIYMYRFRPDIEMRLVYSHDTLFVTIIL